MESAAAAISMVSRLVINGARRGRHIDGLVAVMWAVVDAGPCVQGSVGFASGVASVPSRSWRHEGVVRALVVTLDVVTLFETPFRSDTSISFAMTREAPSHPGDFCERPVAVDHVPVFALVSVPPTPEPSPIIELDS